MITRKDGARTMAGASHGTGIIRTLRCVIRIWQGPLFASVAIIIVIVIRIIVIIRSHGHNIGQ